MQSAPPACQLRLQSLSKGAEGRRERAGPGAALCADGSFHLKYKQEGAEGCFGRLLKRPHLPRSSSVLLTSSKSLQSFSVPWIDFLPAVQCVALVQVVVLRDLGRCIPLIVLVGRRQRSLCVAFYLRAVSVHGTQLSSTFIETMNTVFMWDDVEETIFKPQERFLVSY